MDKTKKKKVQMPSGIRSKLTAAIAMLLISSLLVVGSTYAWFTLSTAPEVTGITTSVGANGNLEIALLNGVANGVAATDTFADMSRINSGVGDSKDVTGKDVMAANITWGNLVDLRDPRYGLQTINLLPSRLNIGALNTYFLKTPVYGADGRIKDLSGKTFASGSFSAGSWGYDSEHLTYGVRAIGANDNLTPQQAGLIGAKAAYNTALNEAKFAIQSALSTNGSELASAITTLAMNSEGVTLTDGTVEGKGNQRQAISNMVTAAETALGHIDNAYKQVLIAAASVIENSGTYTTAVNNIKNAADFAAALTVASGAGVNVTALNAVSTNLTTQKTAVSEAKAAITPADATDANYKTALGKLVDTNKVTVNNYEVVDSNGNTDNDLMVGETINSTFMNKVIEDGGAIVQMPDGSGVFAYVGSVAGDYSAGCYVTISYKGLTLNNMKATMKTETTDDTVVPGILNGITAYSTITGATSLSDTYGYALDFAFRTNAPGSKLQLQTAAANRVYTGDNQNPAIQGAGSSMTFTSAAGANMTGAEIENLMGAIRVAFINPDTGAVYAVAALDRITNTADGMKGDLVLMNYDLDDGAMTNLTAKAGDTKADIMELPQNEATKLTAVVWLDGDYVDNGDVANAAQSITGSMNLQFSSSATLQPMQNTALKTGK